MAGVSFVDGHIDGKQTNYDRIRNMSIEEMAYCNDICPIEYGVIHKYCNNAGCVECRKEWLESEVEGE